MTTKRDPDFFGVIESTAALLAGLQAALYVSAQVFGRGAKRPGQAVQRALREAPDLVRYIKIDVQLIREIVAEADIRGGRAFRPGRRAFLTAEQFKRYERTADLLLGRLRGVLRATNRLYRALPESELDQPALANLQKAQGRFERVLYDRDLSIDDALHDLETGIAEIERVFHQLLPCGTKL